MNIYLKDLEEENDEEGWYLRDALVHEDNIYHTTCFQDLDIDINGETSDAKDVDMKTNKAQETLFSVLGATSHNQMQGVNLFIITVQFYFVCDKKYKHMYIS